MLTILELAESRGLEFTGRARWRRCKQHDSLVIDTQRDSFFWNSRSISGGPVAWLVEVEGMSREEARAALGEKPGYCPPIPKPPKQNGPTPEQIASLTSRAELYHESLTAEARAWWYSQGINDASIDYFRLGYIARRSFKPYCEAYTIPYWHGGRVINLRQRLTDESRGRYRGELAGLGNSLFNIDGLGRTDGLMKRGQAVLFEGEKKAIVGYQVGLRVAGIAGANTWESRFVEHFKAAGVSLVYIALDPGVEAHVTEQIASDFAAAGIRAIISKLPDKPDDMISRGVSAGELLAIIKGQKPYKLSPEAMARRDRIRAESKAKREERAQELARRRAADSAIAFEGEEEIDPEEVRKVRGLFTNATKWAEYCAFRWPDLDAEQQRQIKLKENRERRPETCGEEHFLILTDGARRRYTWTCGICDRCVSNQVATYRRALGEIMGTISPGELDELAQALQAEAEAQGLIGRRGEPAPPLARIHGPLSLVAIATDQDRVKFIRKLRRAGIRYRCLPIEKDGQGAYDFIINSDEWGDPLGPMATDERLKRWVRGYRGRRASGDLLPSLKNLEARYREPLPYEVVLPELDDAGQPVEEDIIYLDLPSIGTGAKLPEVAVDFEVNSRESLQAALLSIQEEQVEILTRRKVVIYGVYSFKRLYTRKMYMPAILAEFNANNERIKAKQSPG